MVERPYTNLGIADLEEIFGMSTDLGALHDLHVELSHRKTSRAKKLLTLVNAKLGIETAPKADVAVLQIELADIQKRYQILRETFTLEGEILARWGMAGSIPREVEDAVFRVWAKLVKVEEDEFGRSVLTLQRDIKVLREERVGMSPIVLSDFGSEE